MEMDPVPGYEYANWELGYGDFHMAPDMPTLREATWLDRTALVLCDVHDTNTHEPVSVAPRSLLKRQIEALAELGYTAKAASELEYYIFQDSYRDAADRKYDGLTRPAGTSRTTTSSRAPAPRLQRRSPPPPCRLRHPRRELQGRVGPRPARDERPLRRRPRHGRPPRRHEAAMKEIADAQGISVTFMAKPFADEAGSCCHIHLSLGRATNNAFAGPSRTPSAGSSAAGWPTSPNSWPSSRRPSTPTSATRKPPGRPSRIAWSHDNRTAGFRVVGDGPSLRIECRMPGADCNPYLAYAAALAAGIDGIRNKTEPPAPFQGDVYQAESLPRVPHTLREAAHLFESSDFVRETFGPGVHEHYAHFFHQEATAYDNAVTDWERQRYFERI